MPRRAQSPSPDLELPRPPAGIEVGELGRLIQKKREDEHLSVRQAAAAANVSFSTLSRVEAGARPDLTTFLNLCGWLGVEPSDFFRPSPVRRGTALDEVTRHLVTDPNLSREAAERIVTVVREMYRAYASSSDPRPDRTPLTLHLRAASIMRPGVPERLASILQDLRTALEASKSGRGR